MLKKPITFNDLDGNPVTEDFYFNLSKAEIAELELSHDGGFSTYLQQIIEKQDPQQIIESFKKILLMSIGRRSEDGRRFIKSQEIRDDFIQSDAYSQFFMELIMDAEAAGRFVAAILPADMVAEVKDVQLPSGADEPEEPAWIRENRDPTPAELQSMTKEQLQEVFRRKAQK